MSETSPGKRPVNQVKVSDRVYLGIKRMVIDFEILPGQQIHIEEVSNRLNVSVTPVREALNRLLNEGFIHRQGGRGFQNRSIDKEELTDLFLLRGSLAISAFHFVLNTELRTRVGDILNDARKTSPTGSDGRIPICRTLLRAVGNKEVLRIYESIGEKIQFVWNIYASTDCGSRHIETYSKNIEDLLIAGDLASCIEAIDNNIKIQISALDEVIPEALARLFSRKGYFGGEISRPILFPMMRSPT